MRRVAAIFLALLFAGACAQSSSESSGGAIEVKARDFAFDPDSIPAEAGRLTFRVRNTGHELHEFEIFRGRKLVDEVEDITPGLERSLTVTLEPGTYEYACKVEDHYERGMKGTLKVT
jgi:iron uptake system component EfeO